MYVFVSDFFLEDTLGGAELTTSAIIKKSSLPVQQVKSGDLTSEYIRKNKNKYWIFGNFSKVPANILLFVSQNLNYSVIEYDYKYCDYRSPEKHIFFEMNCNCEKEKGGKIVSIFFANANSLWYMSKKQKDFYEEKFSFLKNQKSFVLSSVFSFETLQYIRNLNINKKSDEWIFLDSDSWIKGSMAAHKYSIENKLKTKIVKNLPHQQILVELARSKGLIFLPPGMDTCPRIVIEAKLLECELAINNNVQHADEEWFQDKQKIYDYLEHRASFFWAEINKEI